VSATDKLPQHQKHLLRLIRDKIYERSYNLTQVFRGFNGAAGGSGSVHVDLVVIGLRRMINLGEGNVKLDSDLIELVGLCALPGTQTVTYESFASIFKIDDQQDCPLLEGSTGDKFLWGGHGTGAAADMCFNRQGKVGILNDNARGNQSAYVPMGHLSPHAV